MQDYSPRVNGKRLLAGRLLVGLIKRRTHITATAYFGRLDGHFGYIKHQFLYNRQSVQGLSLYLFAHWGALRALLRPYFLRSTMRESRVRKPIVRRRGFQSGSFAMIARERPRRTAPA